MRRAAVLMIVLLLAACGGDGVGNGGGSGDQTGGGQQVYRASCRVCHGTDGGGGVGRPLSGVVETFPDCADQVRWVTLGSERWREEVGPTVGGREVGTSPVMPSFEDTLSENEIRRAIVYERTAFGGADLAATLQDCGLPPPASDE
jgi:mono/diheme cytochrome c family protein